MLSRWHQVYISLSVEQFDDVELRLSIAQISFVRLQYIAMLYYMALDLVFYSVIVDRQSNLDLLTV